MTEFNWKDCAEKLWGLLDDIDTYGDMYKPEITAYFRAVNNKASGRHRLLQSDGYDLFIPGELKERESNVVFGESAGLELTTGSGMARPHGEEPPEA